MAAPSPTAVPNTSEPAPVVEPVAQAAPAEFTPILADTLSLPEGFSLDTPTMDTFLGIMNNRELTPAAQAQALVELQAGLSKAASEAGSAQFEQLQTEWTNEVQADTEVGGANLPKVTANISRLLDTYGGQEVREIFDKTGAGNNVHMVKFLNKIAAAFGEGVLNSGSPSSAQPLSLAQRLYPNLN